MDREALQTSSRVAVRRAGAVMTRWRRAAPAAPCPLWWRMRWRLRCPSLAGLHDRWPLQPLHQSSNLQIAHCHRWKTREPRCQQVAPGWTSPTQPPRPRPQLLRACSPTLLNLGPSWLDLGPSWLHLGPSWLHLGPSWLDLGPSRLDLGPSWLRRTRCGGWRMRCPQSWQAGRLAGCLASVLSAFQPSPMFTKRALGGGHEAHSAASAAKAQHGVEGVKSGRGVLAREKGLSMCVGRCWVGLACWWGRQAKWLAKRS